MSQYNRPYAIDWTTPDKIGGKEPAQDMGGLRKLELNIDDIYDILNLICILYYGTSGSASPEIGRPWLDSSNMPAYAELKFWDGSNWVSKIKAGYLDISEDTSPALGGALNAGAHPIHFTLHTYTGSVGTTTIDWTKGNKAKFTFGAGNETLEFTNPPGSCSLTLVVIQDGTGGRTITWPAGIKWVGGNAPTLTTDANAIDIITFFYDGSTYYGVASLDFG